MRLRVQFTTLAGCNSLLLLNLFSLIYLDEIKLFVYYLLDSLNVSFKLFVFLHQLINSLVCNINVQLFMFELGLRLLTRRF